MRWIPNTLVILATIGIVLGLAVRLIKGGYLADPVFFWRGAVALLAISIAITLIQIRDK
ncbi:MAG TPA: hypothetical protein VKO18_17730 [Terriglobia bacterium]|nr:hypothetical protein [Terriglobia bacterium]